MTPILEGKNVVKRYGKYVAVDRISFAVPQGSIFGLLGPNGAGKTSLIRIITGITGADEGEIWFEGKPITNRHPERIGYMPEERGLYKKMKVGEQLIYLARLKGMTEAAAKAALKDWLDKFEIGHWWNKKIDELSKGMSQKIQFIATVIHEPALLILDEPFSGLDPINANMIEREIHQMKQNGTSIIFSTHRMEQVETICDHLMLVNQGENILWGEVAEIKNRFKPNQFEVHFRGELSAELMAKVELQILNPGYLTFKAESEQEANRILRVILDSGLMITSMHEILPSINDIFIQSVEADLSQISA